MDGIEVQGPKEGQRKRREASAAGSEGCGGEHLGSMWKAGPGHAASHRIQAGFYPKYGGQSSKGL